MSGEEYTYTGIHRNRVLQRIKNKKNHIFVCKKKNIINCMQKETYI